MTISLLSIEEHNERIKGQALRKYLTGVACPKCGIELHYSNPSNEYLSWPPLKDVVCPNCEFKSKIYV